jgi:tetratricopeptide (TPR) repeat protein
MKKLLLCSLLAVAVAITVPVFGAEKEAGAGTVSAAPGEHPHYLHALSDLRAARWMIEHRPGDWPRTVDEVEAVKRIDRAIDEIKKAAIDDGKNLADHPRVDEHPDHIGRLHEAVDYLRKAHEDVNKEEDNAFAYGLKNRALMHISEAIRLTERAIHS